MALVQKVQFSDRTEVLIIRPHRILKKKYWHVIQQQPRLAHISRFYTRGRVIHLDELGPIFVVRLVMRL